MKSTSLTMVFTTARPRPRFDWFFDSLFNCGGREVINQIIIIDLFAQAFDSWTELDVAKRREEVYAADNPFMLAMPNCQIDWKPTKPNVWSGKYRLTPRNWWDKPAAINTGLCLCKSDYIAFVDDRCVLSNTSLDAIREAMENNYAVCGTYSKHVGLAVSDGVVVSHGQITGVDGRAEIVKGAKFKCHGQWMYGHAVALPTEWMLNVNGCDESWCSVSMEDAHFGQMLENNGYPIYHDPRWRTTQDRTPAACEYDMKRSSKEKHPNDKNDKTHKLIERLWNNKQAAHQWNMREIRRSVMAGNPWPIPNSPTEDWFDGQKLSEMV